uniref:Low density lipoprotein n=1 Tax=Adineta vaga TaxID=104782 RepID=G3KGV9_ADIVA|nr:low density lipoprotein [Adineta vaga]
MMLKYLFLLIQFYKIIAETPHFNLHHTDWTSENEIYATLQHDCLYVSVLTDFEKRVQSYQTISYCLTEWPSKWNIIENEFQETFTFEELYQQNVTFEQLYNWSASIKLIEDYQQYRNQRSTTSSTELEQSSTRFSNCTLPKFGSKCQYSLETYQSSDTSLTKSVHDYYRKRYLPISRTCYTQMECDRGSQSLCLGWYEICDGIIDCFNDEIDEKYCWQLKMNKCNENEHQCENGQCILQEFYQDSQYAFECLDGSDLHRLTAEAPPYLSFEPNFLKEDIQFVRYIGRAMAKTSYPSVLVQIELLKKEIFIETPRVMSDDCWLAFKCYYKIINEKCDNLQFNQTFLEIIEMKCPEQLLIPSIPIAFRHIYFLYVKEFILQSNRTLEPHYICYDRRYCDGFLPNRTLIFFNNLTCRKPEDFPLSFHEVYDASDIEYYIKPIYKQLYQCNTILYENSTICKHSKMYQCFNSSKCIIENQLCDNIIDCNYHDDEYCSIRNTDCREGQFKCRKTNKCIPIHLVRNGACDCGKENLPSCQDEDENPDIRRDLVPFHFICDGAIQLSPAMIDNRYESDETECDYWPCDNLYAHRNGKWNCWNGLDEMNCNSDSECQSGHHQCVSSKTFQLICLPIEKFNDGKIDCVGATDELKLCRLNQSVYTKNFYCINDTNHKCILSSKLCAENNRCANGEDEQLCSPIRNLTRSNSICESEYDSIRSQVHAFFCRLGIQYPISDVVKFPEEDPPEQMKNPSLQIRQSHIFPTIRTVGQRCHRGLPLKIWLNNETNLSTEACLCPPSYYGPQCQYDRQRISLTLKFQAQSDSRRTLFTFIVSLIDDQHRIFSYQQYTYHYLRDCRMKYNIYLLYPILSKAKYSIHIDIYEKISLIYRGSFFLPIDYEFLPVHRIVKKLVIPYKSYLKICSNQFCQNGQCLSYANDQNRTFCQCKEGWSGEFCTIRHNCHCSSPPICVGVTVNNESVCVCPKNRWGYRCLLESDPCQSDGNPKCLNDGQCIPDDQQWQLSDKYFCICPKGFKGQRCEESELYLKLTFHKDIILSQSIIFHFISSSGSSTYNTSLVQRISLYQKEVLIYHSQIFPILLIQLLNYYYYLMRTKLVSGMELTSNNQTIYPSYRCKHINELFNETILSLHSFRRLKYYQIPCEKYSPNLHCFYDDRYFCSCDNVNQKRLSSCFHFDTKWRQTCFGLSNCENNAQCIQNDPECPSETVCLCPKCFYGTLCQFSSESFGMSLDGILGYHIQPFKKLTDQPFIIRFSLGLTIVLTILGLINGIFSLLTFKSKELQKTGCGLYLIGSSLTTLSTMIIFLSKFIILLISQINYITNDSFLRIQCYSLDFLLRISLNMDQYLNACVASERALTAYRGINFDKKKSKQLAKYIIISFLLWTIVTTIHDPINRKLVKDNENEDYEKRIWCSVSYSSNLQIFNSIINLIHFFIPFILNLISAFIIIIMTSLQRKKLQRQLTYRHILQEQCREHKHLLIAPIVLVLLAVPRLILSFLPSCMDSAAHVWLPLIAYFISFIPPLLTFVIFVVPSKYYRKEFDKSVKQIQTAIRWGS